MAKKPVKPTTVDIRIAVVVDEEGNYDVNIAAPDRYSARKKPQSEIDNEAVHEAGYNLDGELKVGHILTATLPIPEPTPPEVVAAKVEKPAEKPVEKPAKKGKK